MRMSAVYSRFIPWLLMVFSTTVVCGVAGAGSDQSAARASSVVPAGRQANNVAVITIEGPISKVTAKSVERRLKLAVRSGADAVVFDINTPGGELGAALDICNTIKRSPIVNTVAWINPDAYSAGAVIALACREIITSDPATMGDALPIAISPLGVVALPEHERQKATAPLLAEVVDSARRRGHDEYLVQGIVALGVELWQIEDVATGERLCINRREYEEIFGSAPPTMRPRLVSAPSNPAGLSAPSPGSSADPRSAVPGPVSPLAPDPHATGAAPDALPADDASMQPSAPPDAGLSARGSLPPSDIDFRPAAPGLGALASEITLSQERSSTRPTLTSADRGRWRLADYVSDGNGPYTFRADDLLHFRLATAIVRTDEDLRRHFGAANLRRLDESWSESLVVLLTNNIVRGVLIVVFLIGLALEMFHPGMILPGSVAGIAMVLLVTPPLLIGMANWWEVAAIAIGIALLGVEIFVLPGFGIPGVMGIVLVFVGLIGTFVGDGGGLFPDSPGGRSGLLGGLVTVLTSFVSAGLILYVISKNISAIPVFNKMVLKAGAQADDSESGEFDAMIPVEVREVAVGDEGSAVTPLRPAGKAQFGDRVVDVTSALGYIDSGTRVRVVEADPFRMVVEPADGSAAS
ncbi:MAG: ATP-dependent Clp protease proteolytic subunit [Phycisphaeraceae bacterium]|nr:ATP-dependent Clp protease proteolytic subunit [Phycisphaerae bacterium]MBX3392967.1 ATP-dependent Clp protease proteolytic subunit [Phycisphaeraceae bacterium]